MVSSSTPTSSQGSPSRFAVTRWSIVLAAGDGGAGSAGQRAMGELAQMYWFPLYAYLRRHGLSPADAEDMTQSFFASLLERKSLQTVNPAKGRFRAFLLASVKHFLANERQHARAKKRYPASGPLLSLDSAEAVYSLDAAADTLTPEKLFERRWALAVVDQVLVRLEADYTRRNESATFHALKEVLTDPAPSLSYAQIATTLRTTENAVKTAAHRLRRRYRDLLRDHIAQTVSSPDQVDEEIAYLLNCL